MSDGTESETGARRKAWIRSLLAMLGWDVRLQTRYGIVPAYVVLTAVFALGLGLVAPAVRTEATVLLVATDPAVLGFYFVAVLVLYERTEGVLESLVVSPLGVRGYLLSKTVSLSALAVVASTVVAGASLGFTARIPILLAGVALSASLFVSLGLVSASRFDSVNEYFLSAAVWGAVLFAPVLGYVGLVETPLFYLLPTRPLLVAVEAGLRPTPTWEVAYAFAYLLVANAVAVRWARRSFDRHVVQGGDPGRRLGGAPKPRREGTWTQTGRSPWFALLRTDARNWVRDPMLAFAAAGPVLLAAVVRLATPAVTAAASGVVDLAPYYPVVAGTMAVFGPGIFGFVVAMFVLEDRDEGVLTAYRTTPLSLRGYLLYRGGTAFLFAAVSTLPALLVVGLVRTPLAILVATTLVGAASGSVVALTLGVVASNAIEGLALSKFANLVLLGPALVVALVPEPVQLLAGVLPTYWPVKVYVAGVTGDPSFPLYVAAGVAVHALALGGIARFLSPRLAPG
ncbi:MAG: ABC transporter [Haloarculaceae archaeon]